MSDLGAVVMVPPSQSQGGTMTTSAPAPDRIPNEGSPPRQEAEPAGIPPGARSALLRGPMLPAAPPRIPRSARLVRPQIAPGASRFRSQSDSPTTADIRPVPGRRTFLMLSDKAA